MGRVEDSLRAKGIELPRLAPPLANYVPAKRFGSLVQTAGQVPVGGG